MALLLTPRALAQRGEFYYQLSSMIRAGLPIIAALQTVGKSPPSASYRKPVAQMLVELKGGQVVAQMVGARSKKDLKAQLDQIA